MNNEQRLIFNKEVRKQVICATATFLSCLLIVAVCWPQSNDGEVVRRKAQEVIRALDKKDLRALSSYVHPSRGLRFSPDAHLDNDDRVVRKQNVNKILTDSKNYNWGGFDNETGSTIRLTGRQYFQRYVRPTSPDKIKKTGLNVRIGGTDPSNLASVYPGRMFVEYHTFGDHPNDWNSLRLVFIKSQGDWHLVAVVSDSYDT